MAVTNAAHHQSIAESSLSKAAPGALHHNTFRPTPRLTAPTRNAAAHQPSIHEVRRARDLLVRLIDAYSLARVEFGEIWVHHFAMLDEPAEYQPVSRGASGFTFHGVPLVFVNHGRNVAMLIRDDGFHARCTLIDLANPYGDGNHHRMSWRRAWDVDVPALTATHRGSGLVVAFEPVSTGGYTARIGLRQLLKDGWEIFHTVARKGQVHNTFS